MKFRVCPIQGRQLKDVRKEDIFEDFRICDTYRGGGGYDEFPNIATKRGLIEKGLRGSPGKQLVVQLYGCHLRCPYCYVTKDGIFGSYKKYSSKELLKALTRANKEHNVGVFHLMGGAPALHMDKWGSLINNLPSGFLFHSDLLLTEGYYRLHHLKDINGSQTLYAVNIKGVTSEDYFINTNKRINWNMFWNNLDSIVEVGLNFYLTFTGPDMKYFDRFVNQITERYGRDIMEDHFIINLIDYNALERGKAW